MSEIWADVRARLERLSQPFPLDAIQLAEAHRDEIAQRLAEALEELAADPALGDDPDYMLHLYAMQLLGSWRYGRAYQPLVALGRLHDRQKVEDLFGDHLNESYGRCVASVSGGDLTPIMGLCDDAQALVWARAAGLDAMKACVAEGDADRNEVVAYLGDLGEREANAMRAGTSLGDRGIEMLNFIVSLATDLGAVEMLPAIRGWFAEELLDESFADLDFVETHIVLPIDACLEKILAEGDGYVADAVSEMSWWAAFDDEDDIDDIDDIEDFDWEPAAMPFVREGPKIGRNDPCPCGSGKKYKKCHGAP